MLLKPFVVLTLVLSFAPAARSGDAKDGDTIQGTWLPSTLTAAVPVRLLAAAEAL